MHTLTSDHNNKNTTAGSTPKGRPGSEPEIDVPNGPANQPLNETASKELIPPFLARHQAGLVAQVEAVVIAQHCPRTVQRFIDRVLLDFERVHYDGRDEEITESERTFWFALYQIETLVDPCASPGLRDPYEQLLVNDLESVLPVLAAGGPLPQRFFATRPNECFTCPTTNPLERAY